MTRKQALKIVIFTVLLAWLVMTVTYVIRMSGDTKDRFAGFYAEPDDTIDAVIIGSSPIYPCYSAPKIYGETGITLYPLSSSMQLPAAGYYLTVEARKTQSPQLFIYELRMYTGRENDIKANISHIRDVTDNLRYSRNRLEMIHTLVDKNDDRLSYYLDIIKYHSNWKNLFLPSQLKMWNYNTPDEDKGFVMTHLVGPGEEPMLTTSGDETTASIEALQEQALRRLLDYLTEVNQDALFIVTPYDTDDAKEAQYHYIKTILDEYGYPMLDMNEHLDEIGLDWSRDFQDGGGHTNAVGSRKVTEFLENYLLTNYDWTDHRGDSTYASWDTAYQKYLTDYDEAVTEIERRVTEEDYSTNVADD